MTNILASIVITMVTNVVTTDNSVPPSCCYAVGFDGHDVITADQPFGYNTIPGKKATEQTQTHTVIEIHESVFSFEGQTFRQKVKEKPVMSWQVKLVPQEPWRPVSTNHVGIGFFTFGTNLYSGSGSTTIVVRVQPSIRGINWPTNWLNSSTNYPLK